MGSCISKCIPNKKSHQAKLEGDHDHGHQHEFSHVQDKLVIISQTPKIATQIPLVIDPKKLIISDPSRTPPSPSASTNSTSTSSVSSFVTCTTSKNSIGSSSISSSSSSASSLLSKDKSSFSNEFLWSCYKENPHISRINSLKETSKYYYNNNNIISSTKPTIVSTTKPTCPQKRVRPVSPSPNSSSNLTRQKSFRRDQHHNHHHHHQPEQQYSRDNYYSKCSTLRSSPSPSRRFVNNGERESHSKRVTSTSSNYSVGSNYNNLSNLFSRKENLKPCLRSSISAREQRNVHRISSKIDEIAAAEALACHEIDNVLMEDIDNPLISLDCFIFI